VTTASEAVAPHAVESEQDGRSTLLVSPHLDDAVLSCGRYLAIRPGCTVVTALCGSPASGTGLTPWDALCGFAAGDDVLAARCREDRAALGVLGAHQRAVAGLDGQYGHQPGRAEIVRAGIAAAVTDLRPATCLIPLGLQHEDHIEVRRIALLVAAETAIPADWIAYEDLPYGPNDVGNHDHDEASAAYASAGWAITEIAPGVDPALERKEAAVERYRSQLLALRLDREFDAKIVTERYWALSRR
jgi:LmbE family N-acetylglucosaminyl deacetylase